MTLVCLVIVICYGIVVNSLTSTVGPSSYFLIRGGKLFKVQACNIHNITCEMFANIILICVNFKPTPRNHESGLFVGHLCNLWD